MTSLIFFKDHELCYLVFKLLALLGVFTFLSALGIVLGAVVFKVRGN